MELDMDFLKSLISDFDLMSILPDLADVMEWIIKGVNIALIAGPVLLAVLGLWYLLLPAREANHSVGYRFFWGMGSVKSWKFTQRFAGAVWLVLGSVMAFNAYNNRAEYETLEAIEMMYVAIELILKQVAVVVISCLAINLIVFIIFNFKGNVRKIWRNLAAWIRSLFDNAKEKKPRTKKSENN